MKAGIVLAAALAAGCGSTGTPAPAQRPSGAPVVRVAGSDTMLLLDRRLAEAFMRAHPGVAVRVEGGGSGTGIAALIAGEVEIAAASRPLAADEIEALYERHRTLGVTFLVARDALSVYLNPANPVHDLTVAQLAGIFSGSISSWAEVGGVDRPIHVLIRPPSSGTHRFFRDHVLGGAPYRKDATALARTNDIVATVTADPDAIGYGGVAYGSDVVHCAVDGVSPPTPQAPGADDYPLSRLLTLVTAAPPEGWTGRFIDWAQGPEGQGVVREVGYLPLWERPQPAF